MDKAVQKILTQGFDSGQLTALHTDFQYMEYQAAKLKKDTETLGIFEIARTFANALKKINVSNNWAAYTATTDTPVKYKDLKLDYAEEKLHIVTPAPNDTIHPKYRPGLFDGMGAQEKLSSLQSTQMHTGLLREACVKATIIGAFKTAATMSRPLNIIVVDNCINPVPNCNGDTYIQVLKKNMIDKHNLDIDQHPDLNLHHANSDEIINHLLHLSQ